MKKFLFLLLLCGCMPKPKLVLNGEGQWVEKIAEQYEITQYAEDGHIINQYYMAGDEWYWDGSRVKFWIDDKYISLTGTIQVRGIEPIVKQLEAEQQ